MLRVAREARLCHEYAAISHTPNCAVEREVGDTNFPASRALLVSQGCRGSNANNSSWMRIYLNQLPPLTRASTHDYRLDLRATQKADKTSWNSSTRKGQRIDFALHRGGRRKKKKERIVAVVSRATPLSLSVSLANDLIETFGPPVTPLSLADRVVTSQKAAMKQ